MNQHTMSAADREVFARTEFKKFRIVSPSIQAAIAQLESVRLTFKETRGTLQNPLFVMGPTQAGKSGIVECWKESVATEGPRSRGERILHVTCSPNSSIRSLAVDILVALGDLAPPVEVVEDAARRQKRGRVRKGDLGGVDSWVMYMALMACANAGVEVVVLDELHHMVMSDRAEVTRYSVTEALKKVAIAGVVGLVGVGTERLATIVRAANTKQLAMRARPPLFLRPRNAALQDEATQFAQWVAAVDAKLVEHGIFPGPSNLARKDWLPCFYDVAMGNLGRVSRVVEEAACFAILEGRHRVLEEHLSRACRDWAISLGIADWNPWEQGPRDLRVILKAAREEFPL